jgi:hypothetical protein
MPIVPIQERIVAVEFVELLGLRLPPLTIPRDRAIEVLLAHLHHRRAFRLTLDRQLVGRHVEGAGDVAKLEVAGLDELAVHHCQPERLPFHALLQDRRRAGVARNGLQPLPLIADLLANLLVDERLTDGKHVTAAGAESSEPWLVLLRPDAGVPSAQPNVSATACGSRALAGGTMAAMRSPSSTMSAGRAVVSSRASTSPPEMTTRSLGMARSRWDRVTAYPDGAGVQQRRRFGGNRHAPHGDGTGRGWMVGLAGQQARTIGREHPA